MRLPRTRLRLLATVVLAMAASTAYEASAYAFCRGFTQAGEDPLRTGHCFDGASVGAFELYWRNLCVGYSLQKNASRQVTLDQATTIAANAFGAWSGAACAGGAPSITASDNGPVDCELVQYNKDQPNQHVIVFRDDGWPYSDPYNSLGLTTITFDATSGEIYDADMEINSHDATFGPGGYDLQQIVTHEAGHFLGLAHSTDSTAVMFTTYHDAGSPGLTPDDVAGICSIYLPDGTRTTSAGSVMGDACDATPRHGFATECATADPDAGGVEVDAGNDDVATGHRGCSVSPSRSTYGLDPAGFALLGLGLVVRRVRRRTSPATTSAAPHTPASLAGILIIEHP